MVRPSVAGSVSGGGGRVFGVGRDGGPGDRGSARSRTGNDGIAPLPTALVLNPPISLSPSPSLCAGDRGSAGSGTGLIA